MVTLLLRDEFRSDFASERQRGLLPYLNKFFGWLEGISRHRLLMCLLAFTLTIGARILLLPRIPIPQPYVTDEFSYLLGAETFASGRLTNPPHPMWVHFETFQELMQPTYMSKYPPGQALFLALGKRLLGHPWYGVLISYGLFAACLCWMLQNWVPPVYAVLGIAVTLANISIFGYWMNSYWGGAVGAIGGCILLGTLPRLTRKQVRSKDVVLAAIGIVLLANTRPYEGLVMTAAAVLALLFWRKRSRRSLTELVSVRCLLPLALVFGIGALLGAYYNNRVTGHPLVMPWSAYFQQYCIAAPWILLPDQKPPVYRHIAIENTWEQQKLELQEKRSHPLLNLRESSQVFRFYCSSLYLFPVAIAILLSRSHRLLTAMVILICVWGGLLISSFRFPHYIAGSVGLLPLVAVYGFRWLRVIGRRFGPVLVLVPVALLCMLGRAPDHGPPWEVRRDVLSARMIATQEAMKQGGSHLILVRYAPNHVDKNDECVYNSADIDASEIVWARDMGEAENRELLDYYKGKRKVWLYQPDTDPSQLIPYESTDKW